MNFSQHLEFDSLLENFLATYQSDDHVSHVALVKTK